MTASTCRSASSRTERPVKRIRAMWASFLDFLSEVAALRQELHEESQGAVARAAEKARREQ